VGARSALPGCDQCRFTHRSPGSAKQVSVFDAKGGWLGDVTMPKNFQPYDIGADYVLGKQYIDGVSKVLQFALTQDIKR